MHDASNSEAGSVGFSLEDGVAQIVFNRPEVLNAVDVLMATRFHRVVESLRFNPTVRVIILRGEGRAFMAGGDLQAFHSDVARAPATARAIIDPLHAAIELLAACNAPVIASLHGAVAGAGMSLALGADMAIAADDLKMSSAYARVAASVDGGGTWALPRLVGLRRAMEICLMSQTIDAPTALQVGLVNKVVPAAMLQQATRSMAAHFAQGPTLVFGRIKRLLRTSHDNRLSTQLRAERDAFCEGAATEDFSEGLNAYFEKRAARFVGR